MCKKLYTSKCEERRMRGSGALVDDKHKKGLSENGFSKGFT